MKNILKKLDKAIGIALLISFIVAMLYASFYFIETCINHKKLDCGKVITRVNEKITDGYETTNEYYLIVDFNFAGTETIIATKDEYIATQVGDIKYYNLKNRDIFQIGTKIKFILGFFSTVLICFCISILIGEFIRKYFNIQHTNGYVEY